MIQKVKQDPIFFLFQVNQSCLMGRDESCDIRVQLPYVSKEHCRVEVNENQQVHRLWATKFNGQLFSSKKSLFRPKLFAWATTRTWPKWMESQWSKTWCSCWSTRLSSPSGTGRSGGSTLQTRLTSWPWPSQSRLRRRQKYSAQPTDPKVVHLVVYDIGGTIRVSPTRVFSPSTEAFGRFKGLQFWHFLH